VTPQQATQHTQSTHIHPHRALPFSLPVKRKGAITTPRYCSRSWMRYLAILLFAAVAADDGWCGAATVCEASTPAGTKERLQCVFAEALRPTHTDRADSLAVTQHSAGFGNAFSSLACAFMLSVGSGRSMILVRCRPLALHADNACMRPGLDSYSARVLTTWWRRMALLCGRGG
jgi:hypothetical protein